MFQEVRRFFRTAATTLVVGGMLTGSVPIRHPSEVPGSHQASIPPRAELALPPVPTRLRPTRTPIPAATDYYQDAVYISLRLCKGMHLDGICQEDEPGIIGAGITIYQNPPGIQTVNHAAEITRQSDDSGRVLLSYLARPGELLHLNYPPLIKELGKNGSESKYCAGNLYTHQNTHTYKSFDLEYSSDYCDVKPGNGS